MVFDDFQRFLGENLGSVLTIKEITRTVDSYGDITEGSTTSTINGIVDILDATSDEVKGGILNVGDAIGFFASGDQTKIKAGNRITVDSIEYEMMGEEQIHRLQNDQPIIMVNLKRFQNI